MHGYVLIQVRGNQLERFLNLCENQGIGFHNIELCNSNEFTAILSVSDFFQLQPARRKTQVHIRILEKSGFSFFLKKGLRRKAFFAGLLGGILILLFFHSHIWQIRISGNRMYSTPEILKFLDREGISPGIASKNVSCSLIADLLRKQYPNITWAAARKNGTELLLTIQEGIPEPEAVKENEICDLVAEETGTVVKMVTRSGYPKVRPGDTCERGDTLVLGTFPILNDAQETVRYEQVHADADIYIERQIPYYREYPLSRKEKVFSGEVKTGFFLHAGDWYFFPEFQKKSNHEKQSDTFRITCQWEAPVMLAENLELPVLFGKERVFSYQVVEKTCTESEMEALLWQELQAYEENLMEKGLQISANNVKIKVNARSGVSSGTLTVSQKIGKEKAITAQAQPTEKERNPSESESDH